MQPFDKHPADGGALQSYGDGLISAGAQALQLGQSTRSAYQPAVGSVQGVPAPGVAAAPLPVDQASRGASGALVWGAVATRFWGQQVTQFNAKVDQIVMELQQAEAAARTAASAAAQAPGPTGAPVGPAGPGANPQPALDAAMAAARQKWFEAFALHVEGGGAQAAAMLSQGPTAMNQRIARDAGAMPPLAAGLLPLLYSKAGARFGVVRPDGQGQLADGLYTTERFLNGLSYADKIWYAKNMEFYPQGVPGPQPRPQPFHMRPPAPRPGQFPPGTTFADKVRAYGNRDNWAARPGATTAAGPAALSKPSWDAAARAAKPLGAAVAGASGAVDQWTRDAGRTDLDNGDRAGRAAVRGGLTAGGSLAGAAAGGKLGAAGGFAIGGPPGAAVGGIGGGIVGGVAGATGSNEIADRLIYGNQTETRIVAPGPGFSTGGGSRSGPIA